MVAAFFFFFFLSGPAAHDAKLIFQWRSQRSASSSVGTDSTRKVIAYHCVLYPPYAAEQAQQGGRRGRRSGRSPSTSSVGRFR